MQENHASLTNFARAFINNLLTGARVAFLLPLGRARLECSLAQLLAVVALSWMLAAGNDWFSLDAAGQLSISGVTVTAARGYCWLVALAIVVLLQRSTHQFLRLALADASAEITVWLVWLTVAQLGSRLFPEIYAHYAGVFWRGILVWQVLIFWRVLMSPLGTPWLRAAALTPIYASLLYASVRYLPEEPLFYPRVSAVEEKSVNVESTYYRQPELLDRALSALEPERPGQPDLYFVGFGSYADEDVFMHEIAQVYTIMDERFATGPRSVSLINNPRVAETTPLANLPNLERVLDTIGKKMNVEEDILFLFLTSHGSADGTLAVNFWPLSPNDLSAEELRAALDAAGIKWRVLVVSACYSGSFLETLASPTTLVITAAAKDRTSFGCGHEREWTYFGEAYFNQALRETRSLVQAFELARASIAKREKDEGKEASQPQISIGAEIPAQLARWEAALPEH